MAQIVYSRGNTKPLWDSLIATALTVFRRPGGLVWYCAATIVLAMFQHYVPGTSGFAVIAFPFVMWLIFKD